MLVKSVMWRSLFLGEAIALEVDFELMSWFDGNAGLFAYRTFDMIVLRLVDGYGKIEFATKSTLFPKRRE